MNKKLILGIFITVIAVALIAAAWFLTSGPIRQLATQPVSSPVAPLPSGVTTSVPVSGTSASSADQPKSITVGTSDGGAIATNDFIHNGVTIADAANAGRYLLAGNLGYCVTDPQRCQAASSTDFIVYYDSAQQSFAIALTEEPLGQARLDMEQFMLATLGITQQQMCSLNYYVGTSSGINAIYASKNLGFSFCPGATVLPQ